MPPLLKLWLDKVLSYGWAYGHGGTQLQGKSLLWAVSTGGNTEHFLLGDHPGFDILAQPLQATALYCGMNWFPPFAVHNAFSGDDRELQRGAEACKQRLVDWLEMERG